MIKLFDDWIKSNKYGNKPYLMMGKGPSLALHNKIDRTKYISLGLNHVPEKHKVDVGHAIDYEVIKEAGTSIVNNCEYLLMPWYPNLGFRPHTKNLDELCKEDPILNRFKKGGQLLTYNRYGTPPCPLGGKPINLIFFSGDSVFQLLSMLGEPVIYSIGIDGGNKYNEDFNRLTPLENGRDSFDDQFKVIDEVSKMVGSKMVRLADLETVKVFCGSQYEQLVPAMVLKSSIMEHTHHPVEFSILSDYNITHKMPDDPRNRPRTPFSFQRFMIPSLTSGKAFYLDSDMEVFGDMGELLNLDFGDAEVLACSGMDKYSHWKGSEYAMLLMDCDKIDWDINKIVADLDAGKMNYEELMFDFKVAKVGHKIPPEWNSLDEYEEGVTKLLHYTDMSKQPWRSPAHPHEGVWRKALLKALDKRVVDHHLYADHKLRGFIRDVLVSK